ncbi:hypothetical protein EMGBS15_09180 [Filimonas sp.]|nr:hypothetical protein EMGBS15_09180 [Filimonas sp.]
MNTLTNTIRPITNKANTPKYIHLKEILLAEYVFIFQINKGYHVKDISQCNRKHQLLFQKIENKQQELNLMSIDSIFSIILAEVTQEVLLGKVSSFYQFTSLKNTIDDIDLIIQPDFLKFKFHDFIHHLLYRDIAKKKLYKGNIDCNKMYYLKNENDEIVYYSIYEQRSLQEMLYQKLELDIDIAKSCIKKDKAHICLRIRYI